MNGIPKREGAGGIPQFTEREITGWLLEGDPAVQYLTRRLLKREKERDLAGLRQRMETEGYAAQLLSSRNPDGHWGQNYYQPKWTCTHYTLLELQTLLLSPDTDACREMAARTLDECMLENGGMNLSKHENPSDIGVCGMALSYTAYFAADHPRNEKLLRFLLAQQKADGGFHWNETAGSGEPHTTICVLEGLAEALRSCDFGRREELVRAIGLGVEYLLRNGLFMSGDRRFLRLSYPCRYRYDLLRALEFIAVNGLPADPRMEPALAWLTAKRLADGRWPLEAVHPGRTRAQLEIPGGPSRMTTLKALLVLERYGRSGGNGGTDAIRA